MDTIDNMEPWDFQLWQSAVSLLRNL